MSEELNIIWKNALKSLEAEKDTNSNDSYQRWLKSTVPAESSTNSRLIIEVCHEFALDYVTRCYHTFLQDKVNEYNGSPLVLQFRTKKTTEHANTSDEVVVHNYDDIVQNASKKENTQKSLNTQKRQQEEIYQIMQLNPKYSFDSFVVGDNNRFAHAAAMAISESPGIAYNPFFLYGGVGLGKTHLMQAIGNRITELNPTFTVRYTTCEKFGNEMIDAIRTKATQEFRSKYRNVDVLLIDDIQFLINKEATQEEFFHTFYSLYQSGKQIIISSDRPPKEIQTLEDRLRTRFESGLIADIQAPDLETRVAILKKKTLIDDIFIPNDVLVYIAGQINSNVRELEGALIKITAISKMTGQDMNLELASKTLRDIISHSKPKQITYSMIQEIVAKYFHLDAEEFSTKSRVRTVAFPRQIAMYLVRELTDLTLPKIGEVFGGRDHSTVIHACDKIAKDKENDDELKNSLDDILRDLKKS